MSNIYQIPPPCLSFVNSNILFIIQVIFKYEFLSSDPKLLHFLKSKKNIQEKKENSTLKKPKEVTFSVQKEIKKQQKIEKGKLY